MMLLRRSARIVNSSSSRLSSTSRIVLCVSVRSSIGTFIFTVIVPPNLKVSLRQLFVRLQPGVPPTKLGVNFAGRLERDLQIGVWVKPVTIAPIWRSALQLHE